MKCWERKRGKEGEVLRGLEGMVLKWDVGEELGIYIVQIVGDAGRGGSGEEFVVWRGLKVL